ncbi:MAG: ribbon-helix-helix domain-containing protein [Rhodospirillales bacterium]
MNPPSGKIRKRSVLITGHATSVSVEDQFWWGLKAIAKRRGVSISRLIASIDSRNSGDSRDASNLSSAIRIFVLENLHLAP